MKSILSACLCTNCREVLLNQFCLSACHQANWTKNLDFLSRHGKDGLMVEHRINRGIKIVTLKRDIGIYIPAYEP